MDWGHIRDVFLAAKSGCPPANADWRFIRDLFHAAKSGCPSANADWRFIRLLHFRIVQFEEVQRLDFVGCVSGLNLVQ
jgi:hypothetical protein